MSGRTNANGVGCPKCGALCHGVTDSRLSASPIDGQTVIRRRRKCPDCGYAFSTHETPVELVEQAAVVIRRSIMNSQTDEMASILKALLRLNADEHEPEALAAAIKIMQGVVQP